MKKLENLRWTPRWVSHMGCLKGCLDYLGIEITDAWLFGGIGHAFVINIHEEICPSGPTAWNTEMLFHNGKNLGYRLEGIFGWKGGEKDFSQLQMDAWSFTRKNLDQGIPMYGWELEIPEFYVIYGHDDKGYYYSGPGVDSGKGPKPWQELGNTGIGMIEIYNVRPTEAKPIPVILRNVCEDVLKHASNPAEWIQEGYTSGLAGYETWIHALESGKGDRFGMGYNASVWSECRYYAVEFLNEVKEKIGINLGDMLDDAILNYQVVDENLRKVAELYPFDPSSDGKTIDCDETCLSAIKFLSEAREAEAKGLTCLEKLSTRVENYVPAS